jgi:hypothetical protein
MDVVQNPKNSDIIQCHQNPLDYINAMQLSMVTDYGSDSQQG